MAMLAQLDKLRYHGPQALRCKECRKPFEENHAIEGPTRNRQGYINFQKEYWHANCRHPFGFSVNNQSKPILNSTGKTSWQDEPSIADKTAIPLGPVSAPARPPDYSYNEAPAQSQNGAPNDAADLTAKIVQAVNASILPAVESAVDTLESKLDTHINATNAHDIGLINSRVSNIDSRVSDLEKAAPKLIQIVSNNIEQPPIDVGAAHPMLAEVLELFLDLHPERRNIWLAGPAGSGKTTAAKQVAKAFGMPDRYFFNGAIDTEYKLSGFIDAAGNVINTSFREAWTNGGVYLFDECDGSLASALLAFNGALANGSAPFPGTTHPVPRHPDCYILAAANTWGFGGDSNYVGRAKLDGAFLSRFIRLAWDYDDTLERAIAQNDEWVNVVQAVRRSAASAGAMFLITPRDSMNGADLLRKGRSRAKVVRHIFGYIERQDAATWRQIGQAAITFANT